MRDELRKRASEIDAAIGQNLRALRTACGLSATEAGALVGVTQQQQSKYENGENRLSASRMALYAEAFGIEIEHFFKGVPLASVQQRVDRLAEAELNPNVRKAMRELTKSLLEFKSGNENDAGEKVD